MDKRKFIELAPVYYAVAIAAFMRTQSDAVDKVKIEEANTIKYPDKGKPKYVYISKGLIFDRAVKWLADRGMIKILVDHFGPTIFKRGDFLDETWQMLTEDSNLPFHNFKESPDPELWLRRALRSVNEKFDELGITDLDFDNPDSEWEPLPLDRDGDNSLLGAIQALDEVVRQVRADNGYAVNYPEEQKYVLDGLSGVVSTLKNAPTISAGYLRKYAIEPLNVLLTRFRDAALSVAATAAREAIIEFLKQHGSKALEHIWKILS